MNKNFPLLALALIFLSIFGRAYDDPYAEYDEDRLLSDDVTNEYLVEIINEGNAEQISVAARVVRLEERDSPEIRLALYELLHDERPSAW